MKLVVGVDAGGTASRAVVATTEGVIVGRGEAGPGNPLVAGAAAAVATAVRQALRGHAVDSVVGATLGIAGPATAAQYVPALAALGIRAPISVIGDAVSALASAAPVTSGTVLIAGTGAIAASVHNSHVVETADGLGWLLGDEGSGRWLGFQAIRTAVRDWDSPFAVKVAAWTGQHTANEMVYWAQDLPLNKIATLAPLVCDAASSADPQATIIIRQAVAHLVRTLETLSKVEPIVLAGGLLVGDTPVRDGVLSSLRARGLSPVISRDPAAGAAWLAARTSSPLCPLALHQVLHGRQ